MAYYNGKKVPAWVIKKSWIVDEIKGDRAVIDKSSDGENSISSAINIKFLSVVNTTVKPAAISFKPYVVKITASALNIRKGPGMNYNIVGCISDRGVYTIVDESAGWGKLKSGAGWIALNYTKRV